MLLWILILPWMLILAVDVDVVVVVAVVIDLDVDVDVAMDIAVYLLYGSCCHQKRIRACRKGRGMEVQNKLTKVDKTS